MTVFWVRTAAVALGGALGAVGRYWISGRILRLSHDLPIVIEVVESEDRLRPFIHRVETMIDRANCGALITVERAEVIRYLPRAWREEAAMKLVFLIALTVSLVSLAAAAADRAQLEVVDSVDLDRYLGIWYEIASYPAWFQRDCTAVTAQYGLRDDGLISVVNSCRKGALDGKLKQSKGRAKVVDPETNAKLKVSFFRPFWGDYWIIDLDPDYQWAVVGVPSRKYLWVLSRSPAMDEALYRDILSRLPAAGYDPALLNRTEQPATDGPA